VLVDEARRRPEIRDDETRVVARLAARQADHFGLDDDAALAGPRLGRIARLGMDMLGLPAGGTQGPGLDHRSADVLLGFVVEGQEGEQRQSTSSRSGR